jgi:hypothetical protein
MAPGTLPKAGDDMNFWKGSALLDREAGDEGALSGGR